MPSNLTQPSVPNLNESGHSEDMGPQAVSTNFSEDAIEELNNVTEVAEQVVENVTEEAADAVKNATEDAIKVVKKHPFWDSFMESFVAISLAETFDRSWITCILCVLSYGRFAAFFGSLGALFAQIPITACIGLMGRHFFSSVILHFATAVIFGTIGAHCLYRWSNWEDAGSAAIAQKLCDETQATHQDGWALVRLQQSQFFRGGFLCGCCGARTQMLATFMLVFRAEWGDQTQLAMISLQSSEPLLAVCLGAAGAYLLLTTVAVVIGGSVPSEFLHERFLLLLSAFTFLIFAAVSLWQALHSPFGPSRFSTVS